MPKKSVSSSVSTKVRKQKVDEILIQNLIELQKVHTNLLERFDKLSSQLTVLLNLFESAARSFSEHPANKVNEKDKDFLEKVDKLLDQNKTIAKGLTLMEDRLRQKIYGPQNQNPEFRPAKTVQSPEHNSEYQPSTMNKNLQRF